MRYYSYFLIGKEKKKTIKCFRERPVQKFCTYSWQAVLFVARHGFVGLYFSMFETVFDRRKETLMTCPRVILSLRKWTISHFSNPWSKGQVSVTWAGLVPRSVATKSAMSVPSIRRLSCVFFKKSQISHPKKNTRQQKWIIQKCIYLNLQHLHKPGCQLTNCDGM